MGVGDHLVSAVPSVSAFATWLNRYLGANRSLWSGLCITRGTAAESRYGVKQRRAVPYEKLAQMWKEGKSYEEMARAVKRYHATAADPTKHMRAIVSGMLTRGYTNQNGRTVVLKPRKGMRAIGVGKKVQKGVR